MSRLATGFWVAAYRARLEQAGVMAYVAKRGDDTAGAVLVKLATLDGQAQLFQRSYDLMSGERTWVTLAEGAESDVDAAAARQASFDPDLWIIEVEDRHGRHLLGEDGLA